MIYFQKRNANIVHETLCEDETTPDNLMLQLKQ